MAGNGNGGGMMIVVLIGGVCCLCLLSSGGLGLLYAFNADFKYQVNKLFNINGGGKSSKAGQYVCPDVDSGVSPFGITEKNGIWWCKHPDASTSSDQNIKNDFRASRLPSEARSGKKYTPETLLTEDGSDGVYGPNQGWGYKPTNNPQFTAP